MHIRSAIFTLLLTSAMNASSLDLAPLWDFSQPELSAQRFRDRLEGVNRDDALILQTQIARTYGLRKDFVTARSILESIARDLPSASAEAQARHALELGRTYASATHPKSDQTPETKAAARAAYERALAIAKTAALDGLAIDAIHMLAFVDTAPADQLKWGLEALAVVEASSQPAAKKWEASVRNNVGYAMHQLGRYDEALTHFKKAVVLRELGTNGEATRSAHWMVAWTLRALGKADEALAIQLRLERECQAANMPDRYVFEELELLYRAKGDAHRAQHYADLVKATPG